MVDGISLGQVEIAERFAGPPGSGNGGYVCGRLAEFASSPVRVRLMRPPPLKTPLEVSRLDQETWLHDGDHAVARAWPYSIDMQSPKPLTIEQARAARERFTGFEHHAFPGCFVCGPDREASDGLRIFPGATEEPGLVACNWTADASLGDENDQVQLPFIWAALDCPSGWAFLHATGKPSVLGEYAVSVMQPLAVGEEVVLCGWVIAHDGRKHHCGSALFNASGECLALAHSTWIQLDR